MEIYTKTEEEARKYLFGTERTFAFIALLGFILLRSESLIPHVYLAGFLAVTIIFIVYYFQKVTTSEHRGITIIMLGLLVYAFPLILQQFPSWFSMLIITMIMVLVEIKTQIKEFAKKIYSDDYLTLAKFVLLSGVILPLVPDREIITGVPVSPYKLWLAIVVISSISYMSYLLRKYVFPKAGLILTGILGGLYSSTATTFILAKKSREAAEAPSHYAAAILAATGLMFLRIYILIIVFDPSLCLRMAPCFGTLIAVSALVTFFIYKSGSKQSYSPPVEEVAHQNPLELKVALIFGVLYVVFSLLTKYTMQYYGHSGLNALSFVVGFTDIDPFLLNMFQGKYEGITMALISAATLQAIASNNLLKMIYALSIGDKSIRKYIAIGFSIIIAANLLVLFFV
jgi:uncharacterized membrane protein (DUF4010 family)